ncbi:MAG: hypothetical protein KF745_12190 [Phycisphaeraceae bacterium]|nr:hypothetical protein [Phycisphaeraceae bacterium]
MMTQNPYAQMGGFADGRDPFAVDPIDQRTSLLAVFSLVFSLLCCIPGTGAIGAILGGASLVAINSARGRLRGTGMAVTGIVLGLVATAIWIIGFVTISSGLKMFDKAMMQPIAAVVTEIETGDADKVNTAASGFAMPAVTEDQVKAFRKAYSAELGSFKSMPTSMWDLVAAYTTVGQQMQSYQPGSQHVMPVPASFDKGWALILVEMNPNKPARSTGMPVTNIGVWAPSGQEFWLLPQTPGVVPGVPQGLPPGMAPGDAPQPEQTPPSGG